MTHRDAGGLFYRTLARDRPSRYGIEDVPFHRRAGACPPPCPGRSNARERQAVSVYRRAGACPPPCCGLPKPREGQALALRYRDGDWALGCSRGTGPRATGGGRVGHRMLARDRPSRYGVEARIETGRSLLPEDIKTGRTRRQLITKKRVPGRKKAWGLTQSMLASQAEMHTQRE